MSILDLLKAAKGERSTEGQIGRWRKAVSLALDTGAGAPADYIHSKNSAEPVGGDQEINVRGITRPSTTVFQLTPGKTYHLISHARFDTFSDPTTGRLVIRWVDDSNTNIPLVPNPDATASLHVPTTSTDNSNSADPVTEAIYTVPASPASASLVKLRCTSATGTATLPANAVS